MNKFKKVKEAIYAWNVEKNVEKYVEIIESYNAEAEVNEEALSNALYKMINVSFDFDADLSVEENVEKYVNNQDKNHSWWDDWDTEEELYDMGIKNMWIKK